MPIAKCLLALWPCCETTHEIENRELKIRKHGVAEKSRLLLVILPQSEPPIEEAGCLNWKPREVTLVPWIALSDASALHPCAALLRFQVTFEGYVATCRLLIPLRRVHRSAGKHYAGVAYSLSNIVPGKELELGGRRPLLHALAFLCMI